MWERNIDWLLPTHATTGDWTHNLGMCPDQESNPQHFGVQDDAPTNWATPAREGDHCLKAIGGLWEGKLYRVCGWGYSLEGRVCKSFCFKFFWFSYWKGKQQIPNFPWSTVSPVTNLTFNQENILGESQRTPACLAPQELRALWEFLARGSHGSRGY